MISIGLPSFFTVGNPLEIIPLERNSQEFYLLQRIQDEVHRFAISFHRQIRSKNAFQSMLDDIAGIGEKRRKLLLKTFGSVKKMKEASMTDFTNIGIPAAVAEELIGKLKD